MDRTRWRIILWLDEAAGPQQVAIAKFRGDDKLTETTVDCEPFDTRSEALAWAEKMLDVQGRLW